MSILFKDKEDIYKYEAWEKCVFKNAVETMKIMFNLKASEEDSPPSPFDLIYYTDEDFAKELLPKFPSVVRGKIAQARAEATIIHKDNLSLKALISKEELSQKNEPKSNLLVNRNNFITSFPKKEDSTNIFTFMNAVTSFFEKEESSITKGTQMDLFLKFLTKSTDIENIKSIWNQIHLKDFKNVKYTVLRALDSEKTDSFLENHWKKYQPLHNQTLTNFIEGWLERYSFIQEKNGKADAEVLLAAIRTGSLNLAHEIRIFKIDQDTHIYKGYRSPHDMITFIKNYRLDVESFKFARSDYERSSNSQKTHFSNSHQNNTTNPKNSKSEFKKKVCYGCLQDNHSIGDCRNVITSQNTKFYRDVKDRLYYKIIKENNTFKRVKASNEELKKFPIEKYTNSNRIMEDLSNSFRNTSNFINLLSSDARNAVIDHSQATLEKPFSTPIKQITINDNLIFDGILDTGSQHTHFDSNVLQLLEKAEIKYTLSEKKMQLKGVNGLSEIKIITFEKITIDLKSIHSYTCGIIEGLGRPLIGIDLIHLLKLELPPVIKEEFVEKSGKYKISLSPIQEGLKDYIVDDITTIYEEEESKETNKRIKFHPNSHLITENKILKELMEVNFNLQGITTLGEISLILKDPGLRASNVWQNQHHLGPDQKAFEKEVEDYLKAGWYEPFNELIHHEKDENGIAIANYNTKIFPVHQGTKTRFVGAYGQINNLLKEETNSFPGVEEAFLYFQSQINNFGPDDVDIIRAKIDIRHCFRWFPIREVDRSYTSFTLNTNRFRSKTCPEGLKILPSAIHRMIRNFLQRYHLSAFCYSEMDDIIVTSIGVENHIEHLCALFTALNDINLGAKPTKCHIGCVTLPVLGMILNQLTIQPDTDKVINWREWKRPNNKRDILSLLGLVNWFRKFLANVTELLLPFLTLAKNLQEKERFTWTTELELAYEEVFKRIIDKSPIIHFHNKNYPINIATDASRECIGCCVYQIIDNKTYYIAFGSRILKNSELLYSIPKKELLAVVIYTEKFRYLLSEKKFNVFVDNEGVVYLLKLLQNPSMKEKTLMSWLVSLATFNFKVEHLPGRLNQPADILSRIQSVSNFTNSFNTQTLDYYTIEKQKEILEQCHSLGHFGSTNMYNHIKYTMNHEKFPSLHSACQNYTADCKICCSINKHRIGWSPTQTSDASQPLDHIYYDFLKVKRSNRGYQYVLIVIDYITKFVWLKATKGRSSVEVVRNLIEIFMLFGCPITISSDNAKEFLAEVVKSVEEDLQISHIYSFPFHHNSMGAVERYCWTTRDTIVKLCKDRFENNTDWDLVVPFANLCMNMKFSKTTKTTPFSMMYGRHPFRTKDHNGTIKEDNESETFKRLNALYTTMNKFIIPHINSLRKEQTPMNPKNKKLSSLNIGDSCWKRITDEEKQGRKLTKEDDNYYGPFLIKNIIKGNCMVESKNDIHSFPISLLKKGSKEQAKKENLYSGEDDSKDSIQTIPKYGYDEDNTSDFEPTQTTDLESDPTTQLDKDRRKSKRTRRPTVKLNL